MLKLVFKHERRNEVENTEVTWWGEWYSIVKVCSVTKVALGQDELVTCKGHGYPHHVIIMIIIIIIFLLLLLIIIITITTRWAVVPLWLGLSLPTVESAFSQGLRAILILKRSSPKPNPKSKPWYQNIARIAKGALHKLPGKSSFNVRSVCPRVA